ncbi:MAG: hypothetical protein KFB93_02760 [Simkaniaceae bacterium]|jgi:hypothetical protein|nr:MAG: hypothetical protein KFB93_02760 [Simkaniaceae bacterium]
MNKEDKKTIAVNFRKDLETFTSHVNELTKNSGLPTKRDFLERIANDVNSLYASSIKVQKEINEDIEEIGSIIQNIFVQPLAIKPHHSVTILKAVESFNGDKKEESDLSHVMREYVKHPESTKSFIRELEILREDLDAILKKIA